MTFTKPALVATDLDGTIVDPEGAVSARTVAAFERLRRAGVPFVFVTGRSPRGMDRIIEDFGGTGIAICSNGALLYDLARLEVVEERSLAPDVLAAAAARLRAAVPGIGLAVEYAFGMRSDPLYEPWDWDSGTVVEVVSDAELFAQPAPKLLGRHPTLSAEELLAAAGPALAPAVTPYHSNGSRLIEVVAAGVDKAAALARFAARHGVPASGVAAFGDMVNDLPMLSWAGTSYGVANAHPEVLARVDHVIGANVEDGVAAVLEQLFPEAEDEPAAVRR